MKLAVMQPYIFPYAGYFQLINAVDTFVFYDDVNFIKQGWINRNQILVNNEANLFTVPLNKASSFKQIKEVEINSVLYPKWKKKFLRKIEQSYGKAPYFKEIFPIISNVFSAPTSTISNLAIRSIIETSIYLGLHKKFKISSEKFADTKECTRTQRLVSISHQLKANTYINALGGKELYKKKEFKKEGVELQFLKPSLNTYEQFGGQFVQGLSIIDVLMFNNKEKTNKMLNEYSLL